MSSTSAEDDSSNDNKNKNAGKRQDKASSSGVTAGTAASPDNLDNAGTSDSAGKAGEHECECSLYTDTPSHVGVIPLVRKKSSMVLSEEALTIDTADYYVDDNEEAASSLQVTADESPAVKTKKKDDSKKKKIKKT
ncbi:uncharacterized protein LOC121379563 [Gigantopelta aegis]|uniref:uncharacterized protein LOC121379563 n=1 Tax=Gigantopelta aegis TaxID=1735272 RepID=UPI001B88DCF4|nr:uncharacterized protein LOC121379563 [Gigantopelta aegis]XP_041364155.1 uncharacterized protein LOC121379563 [Gigantopelta aegis]